MRFFQNTRRSLSTRRTVLAVQQLDARINPSSWDGGGEGWPGEGDGWPVGGGGGGGQPPALTVVIDQGATQADVTSIPSISFDVHFSGPVYGLDSTDIDLSTSTASGPLSPVVTGFGADYVVTVNGMKGPGIVSARIPAGAAIDGYGSFNWASTSSDNSVTFFNSASGSTFLDQDGDKVTVKLTGGGAFGYDLTNGRGPIDRIELTGTDAARSTLTISVLKANATTDGKVEVGAITGTGLKSLSARSANLTGEGIHLAGAMPSQKTSLSLGRVGDSASIVLDTAISSLTAASIGAAQIIAPSAGTMSIRGDFHADMTLTGEGVQTGKFVLSALRVTGDILGSDIRVGGNVGLVQADSLRDSTLYAYGLGGNSAIVKSFQVTDVADAFQNSRVVAGRIQSVSLRSVDSDNGGSKFGFTAHEGIGRLTIGKPVSFTYKTGDAALVVGDFEVRLA